MPNHIRNVFKKVSEPHVYKKIALNSDGEIDFSILIHVPETMNIVSGSQGLSMGTFSTPDEIDEVVLAKVEDLVKKKLSLDEIIISALEEIDLSHINITDKKNNKYLIKKENLITKIIGAYNFHKFGYKDWYDYSCAKFGTKWNAYSIEKNAYDLHSFNTAWTTPSGWLQKLAKHIDFILYYADEDTGYNCGYVVAKNGEVLQTNIEDYSDSINITWAYYIKYNKNDLENYINEFEDGDKSGKDKLELALKRWDENIKIIESEAQSLYESTK